MKRTAGLFFVAIVAGSVTLGAYKLLFEKNNNSIFVDEGATPFVTTSTMASAKGAGINEVDFTIAAEKTVNAVVHVKNMTVSSGRPNSIMDFIYGFQGQQQPQVGTGSGVIISPDGYIVTNNHVIASSQKLEVTLNNNRTYEADVVGADEASDIALLKVDTDEDLPFLAFGDSDNTKIGEWVLAVGNPFNLTSTVTAGIVSAKARSLGRNQSFIQTDAAVNPGNSGGALVNTNGDLIGINTAITSQTGSYVGYSFAVPSNIAKKVVDDLLEYGNVQKGILGVSTIPKNTRYAEEMGINEIEGVYVNTIEEDSGAEQAGIQEGDIIKKVDNVKVTKFSELTGYLNSKRPNDVVEVSVERDGEVINVPVTLMKNQTTQVPNMGFVVKNLSDNDKKNYKLKNGVKITAVPEQYSRYGLVGKVIVQVDDDEIDDITDADEAFSKVSKYRRTSITLIDEEGEKERLIFQ